MYKNLDLSENPPLKMAWPKCPWLERPRPKCPRPKCPWPKHPTFCGGVFLEIVGQKVSGLKYYTQTKSTLAKSFRHRTKSNSIFYLKLFCTYKLNYILHVLHIFICKFYIFHM